MEKLDGMSMDLEGANLDKLRGVFPEIFVEDRLDLTKLLDLLGQYDIRDFEKYKFEWKGKSECLRLAQRRSTGTLRPKPDESVNFDKTNNIYIKGDNLEVLKLLQSSYYRTVKMIYFDPPYNTGNDFVYEDDFTDPIAKYREVTSQTTRSNPETMGRFHTAWLNMMYPRLRLAANLLRDDGVCFISIGEKEVVNLRKLCEEVFGEENFVAQLIWQQKSGGSHDEKYIVHECEYVLVFAKSKSNAIFGRRLIENENYKLSDSHVSERGKYSLNKLDRMMRGEHYSPALNYPITAPDGSAIWPGGGNGSSTDWNWRWSKTKTEWGIENDFLEIKKDSKGSWAVYSKQYEFVDNNGEPITRNYPFRNLITSSQFNTTQGGIEILKTFNANLFDYSKPSGYIKYLIQIADVKNNDIILDFFSGSATTAHAVMQLNAEGGGNRQFIMVQLPELCDEKSEAYKAGYKNICEIGMERIRRAGSKILAEQSGQLEIGGEEKKPLDVGFKVFELDTSNLKTWDATPIPPGDDQLNILFSRMNSMLDNVKPDRTDLDMVYEIMLKMGIPLTYPVTPVDVRGKKAYSVREDCLLLICLAEDITPEMVEEMCEYAPANLIIGENGVKDATAMANAHYICKDRHVELKLV